MNLKIARFVDLPSLSPSRPAEETHKTAPPTARAFEGDPRPLSFEGTKLDRADQGLNVSEPLKLSERQIEKLLVKMPCPFMGNMMKEGKIPIYGSLMEPLIKIDDIKSASGNGTLGEVALEFFAVGNHTKLLDASDAPKGFISAQLTGSQGDHPRVSTGIFKTTNPKSAAEYAAQFLNADGLLDAKGMGRLVAHRLFQRSSEEGTPLLSGGMLRDLSATFREVFLSGFKGISDHEGLGHLLHADFQQLEGDLLNVIRKEAKALGTIPAIGKAGEFGLWLEASGPVSREQLETFVVGRSIPEGFEEKHKTNLGWAAATSRILADMVAELIKLKEHPEELKPWTPSASEDDAWVAER